MSGGERVRESEREGQRERVRVTGRRRTKGCGFVQVEGDDERTSTSGFFFPKSSKSDLAAVSERVLGVGGQSRFGSSMNRWSFTSFWGMSRAKFKFLLRKPKF